MTALNSSKKNLIIILVIVFTLMLILCIRLGWVQIVKGSKYSELAVEQQTKDTPIEAKRGVIYDTNGNELAVSVTCYTIWARPADVRSDVYKRQDIWRDIYTQYIDAGSDIIYAGTFGMNRFKSDELDMPLEQAVAFAMDVADDARKAAAAEKGRDVKVALGIGPLGELLEPMGILAFEDAYDAFAEIIRAGRDHGADLVVIETMTDLYEVRAAVLAAKENSDLPVMVSIDVYKRQELCFS